MVRIVLVEPWGSLNLGSVARVMKNMGLTDLILVNPHCSPQDPEAIRMAVHGRDVLDTAQIVDSLSAALQDCQRTIGTLGRTEPTPPEWQIGDPRHDLPWLLEGSPSALVFGSEDRGLSNAELALCQRQITIPAHADYPSLNLAQAVAICAYELFRSTLAAPLLPSTLPHDAPSQLLEGFYEHWQETLLTIGYLQPHTATRQMQKFRALFNRAHLSRQEIALLRGILRQSQWVATQAGLGSPFDPSLSTTPNDELWPFD